MKGFQKRILQQLIHIKWSISGLRDRYHVPHPFFKSLKHRCLQLFYRSCVCVCVQYLPIFVCPYVPTHVSKFLSGECSLCTVHKIKAKHFSLISFFLVSFASRMGGSPQTSNPAFQADFLTFCNWKHQWGSQKVCILICLVWKVEVTCTCANTVYGSVISPGRVARCLVFRSITSTCYC